MIVAGFDKIKACMMYDIRGVGSIEGLGVGGGGGDLKKGN